NLHERCSSIHRRFRTTSKKVLGKVANEDTGIGGAWSPRSSAIWMSAIIRKWKAKSSQKSQRRPGYEFRARRSASAFDRKVRTRAGRESERGHRRPRGYRSD